ncbi:MAG: hypothetical protein DCC75_08880 [Proteobacteria bacterium]|nr:MAG: hypothetical protein DCC75_08880 [Pseudomonadota bacterium]
MNFANYLRKNPKTSDERQAHSVIVLGFDFQLGVLRNFYLNTALVIALAALSAQCLINEALIPLLTDLV